MDKVSYALGMSIGRQLQQMAATDLDINDFAQAIKDVFAGKPALSSNKGFSDVKKGQYYVDAINWAAEAGITLKNFEGLELSIWFGLPST